MQFENLLKQPADSPRLLLREAPYGEAGRALLLQEVIGLANADGGSASRHILFGIYRDDAGKTVLSKLRTSCLKEIETYADIVRQYVEPDLRVTPIVGDIKGHLVAALELSHCVNPPYMIKIDVSTSLRRGDCWVRAGGLFRPAQRSDLERMFRISAAHKAGDDDDNIIKLGFNHDPNLKTLRIPMPDVSNPPSKLAASRMEHEIEARRDAVNKDVIDTGVQRLVHARLYGNESRFEEHSIDTMVEGYNAVIERYKDEDNYYYFETNGVQMNLAMANSGHETLENISLLLTFPCAPEFRVADCLHPPPGKTRTPQESELLGYPRVKHYDKAVQVKYTLDSLEPDKVVEVFEAPLRMAVLPALAGKKVRAKYSLQADSLDKPETGRLTLLFNK